MRPGVWQWEGCKPVLPAQHLLQKMIVMINVLFVGGVNGRHFCDYNGLGNERIMPDK